MDYSKPLAKITAQIEILTNELSNAQAREQSLEQQRLELQRQLNARIDQISIEREYIKKAEQELVVLRYEGKTREELVRISKRHRESELRWVVQDLEDVHRNLVDFMNREVAKEVNDESLYKIRGNVQSDLTDAYENFAKQLENEGNIDQAIHQLEKAKEICNDPDLPQVRAHFASLLEIRGANVEDYRYALDEWEAIGDSKRQMATLLRIADLCVRQQEFAQAIEAYRRILVLLGPRDRTDDIKMYLKRIEHYGELAGASPVFDEVGAYQWTVQYYESKGINPEYSEDIQKYIEGLEQLIKLVDARNLPNITEQAKTAKKRLEDIEKKLSKERGDIQNLYDMCSLPSELNNQLRGVLSSCGPFTKDDELQAVFVDSRISPWRENIPQASSRAERVRALINFLCDKHDANGENVLILFLSVLKDQSDPGDMCHQSLADLIDALRRNYGEGE